MSTQRLAEGRRLLAKGSALLENIVALMVATLVLAAFIGVAALVPAVSRFVADGAPSVSLDDLRRCAAIAGPQVRLSCYDDIADLPLPHPAKGANAPAAAFGAPH
jgi:hypothetical protein